MAEAFNQRPNEKLLAQAECLEMRRPLAYGGELRITDQRIHFSPSKLNRIAGAGFWEFGVDAIDDVRLQGIDKLLWIRCGEHERRLSGKNTEVLFERLRVLVAEKAGVELADARFEPGEQIRLQQDVELYLNDLVSTSGRLTLTNRRLRFDPGRSLERLIWGDVSLDQPLTAIKKADFVGVRRRLAIDYEGRQCVFGGSGLPTLYGMLVVLCERGGLAGVVGHWSGSVHKGPLAHNGEFVLGYRRLIFSPTGTVESVVGLGSDIRVPMSTVTRISVTGRLEKRLVVHTKKEQHTFSLPDPIDRAMEYLPLLRQLDARREIAGKRGKVTAKVVASFLNQWKELQGEKPHEAHEMRIYGPVVELTDGPNMRRGWLFLMDRACAFIPGGGPSGSERPAVAEPEDVQIIQGSEEGSQDLLLSIGTYRMHAFPREGAGFVQDFVARLQRLCEERASDFGAAADANAPDRAENLKEKLEPSGFSSRRGSYRLAFKHQILGYITGPGATEETVRPTDCRLRDLSATGCCMLTSMSLKAGEVVELNVDFQPPTGPLRMEVMHGKRMLKGVYRYGCRFTGLQGGTEAALNEVLMEFQRVELMERLKHRDKIRV